MLGNRELNEDPNTKTRLHLAPTVLFRFSVQSNSLHNLRDTEKKYKLASR